MRSPACSYQSDANRSRWENAPVSYGYCGTESRIKTTIELPDALVKEAKQAAAEEGISLRALVDRALRDLLEARRKHDGFRLRDASVGGRGLTSEWRDAGWDRIRDEIYRLSD
jgi:Arc/MetJ family transcription regulator